MRKLKNIFRRKSNGKSNVLEDCDYSFLGVEGTLYGSTPSKKDWDVCIINVEDQFWVEAPTKELADEIEDLLHEIHEELLDKFDRKCFKYWQESMAEIGFYQDDVTYDEYCERMEEEELLDELDIDYD